MNNNYKFLVESVNCELTDEQYPLEYINNFLNELDIDKLLTNTDRERLRKAEREVRTTPPKVFTLKNDYEMIKFNVKAFPSREDKRHKGYIIHDNGDVKQLYCDCIDFFFRMFRDLINAGLATTDLPKEYKELYDRYKQQPPESVTNKDRLFICKHLASMKKYLR